MKKFRMPKMYISFDYTETTAGLLCPRFSLCTTKKAREAM